MSCTPNIRRGEDGDWPMCGAGSNIVAKAYYSRQRALEFVVRKLEEVTQSYSNTTQPRCQ